MSQTNTPHFLLAHKLAGYFAKLPQVEAIALGGSQTSGSPDATSDIDLYVYTRGAEIPLSVRQSILAQSGGASTANLGLTYWGPGDEWVDAATGIEVDLVYFDADWMQQQINRVILDHQPSLGYTTCFWHTCRHSQSLHDPQGWFASLQTLSQQPYPEPLRTNIITYNHPVLRQIIPSYFNQIEKAVNRQDLVSLNHRLAALFTSYFDILFAVNRLLHPGEKRLLHFARSRCRKLPVDFDADMEQVMTTSARPQTDLLLHLTRLLDHLDVLLEAEKFM